MAERNAGGRARQVSSRDRRGGRGGDSRKTVLVALAANAVIAVTKLAGGLISGSAALLAEAAHSLADTVNQGFLLVSIALADRPATEEQPFGHGRQRFLWAFVAAVSMFVAGAVFAVGYGIYELLAGEESGGGGYGIAWAALAIAALTEGASWVRALRQTRAEAREAGRPLLRHVRATRDPSVKMVLFEDTAALVGIAFAAAGIALGQLTGQRFWDPAASVAIGLMLIGVATWMAHDTGELLSGASARPDERAEIERVLEDHPAVVEVVELLTMVLGPNALLVAARLDLDDELDGAAVERIATELDHHVREAVPDVTEVFLDATDAQAAAAAAAD
ncbi:MAG TPA: cation diffusion facilitator family transporter [Baekduia sp.]|nr:cation diffusion facilitator family transporter [Baekduia sp.]